MATMPNTRFSGKNDKILLHPKARKSIKAVIIDNSRQDDILNVQLVGVAPDVAIRMLSSAIEELRGI